MTRHASNFWTAAPIRRLGALLFLTLIPPRLPAQSVQITLAPGMTEHALTGRLFLCFSRDSAREPRQQLGNLDQLAPFFASDVSGLEPGSTVTLEGSTPGFPMASLQDLPAGEYSIQALLNLYTRVTPAHGRTIEVPWDQWNGRRSGQTPGDLISTVQKVQWDPRTARLSLTLSQRIPPRPVPADSMWVKHVKIQSRLLSIWWRHPVYLGATVLLPRGWTQHPQQHYAAIYLQSHFGLGAPFGFNPGIRTGTNSTDDKVTDLYPVDSNNTAFSQAWMGDDFPRVVLIRLLSPTPWFDNSYALNGANQGPYTDAILSELIPYLERTFRLIPDVHARLLSGGSSGGWVSLALQIHYPEVFGGTWSLYPDSVDFTRAQNVDLYNDRNLYLTNASLDNPWLSHDRPLNQSVEGQPLWTHRQYSQMEQALGSHSRGGQQWQAYEALYGPVGTDGYPQPVYDRTTGTIDKTVSDYWRSHGYDLTEYLRDHWSSIGPQLTGKIHVYVGEMDTFYLHLAVYRLENTLSSFTAPPAQATFEYGRPMKPHGWQPFTNTELIRMMAKYIAASGGVPPPTD